MTKSYIPFTFSLGKEDADQRLLMVQQLRTRGNGKAPEPPRNLQSQPGSRGALLTWKLPESGGEWIRGWRVYKDTESNLYAEVQDRGRRQMYVMLSSGENPPVTNFFVSSISAAGAESRKVPAQVVAVAEPGAPNVPAPPPGYGDESAGGIDRTYRDRNRRVIE